ncbi:MAG TPA: hypothetical protein VGB78_05940 [Thermoplasmata archaeon]
MASEDQLPEPPPPPPLMPPVPERFPRGKVVFILFFVSLAIVAIAVLSTIPIIEEDSPEDALADYADALNDRDVKRMFDQTVLRFSDEYQDRLSELEDLVFVYDPYMTVNSSHAVYREDMTDLELLFAEALVTGVEDLFDVQVDDFCILEYTYTIEYRELGFESTFTVETVCAKMYGDWYLVFPQYF